MCIYEKGELIVAIQFNQAINANRQAYANHQKTSKNPSFGAIEKTLIFLKPDAFEKGLEYKISHKMLKETGLKVTKIWEGFPGTDKLKAHYAEHKEKGFFNTLIEYATRGKIKAYVLEGEGAVNKARETTFDLRKEFGATRDENFIHASDSPEAATRELLNLFG